MCVSFISQGFEHAAPSQQTTTVGRKLILFITWQCVDTFEKSFVIIFIEQNCQSVPILVISYLITLKHCWHSHLTLRKPLFENLLFICCATVRMVPSIFFTLLFHINTSWGDTKEMRLTTRWSHHWARILSDDSNFHWVNRSAGSFFQGWKKKLLFHSENKSPEVAEFCRSKYCIHAFVTLKQVSSWMLQCLQLIFNTFKRSHLLKNSSFGMNDHLVRLLGLLYSSPYIDLFHIVPFKPFAEVLCEAIFIIRGKRCHSASAQVMDQHPGW